MRNYTFKETQKFNQLWIWMLLVFVIGITVYSSFYLSPSDPSFELEKLIPFGIVSLVILLFISLKLETRIDSDSSVFSYFPLIRKRKYDFNKIESMEFIVYNSLWEYGGWGIRINFDSWSYNTGGKFGIMVKTKDKKFLIGTHKPEEAKKAIALFDAFKSKNHGS